MAVQYGINAVGIVFNDNAYGNVLRAQMEEFDGHVLGTQLHNPDFVTLAQSFGARGVLAEDSAALESALREALDKSSDKVGGGDAGRGAAGYAGPGILTAVASGRFPVAGLRRLRQEKGAGRE